MSDAHVVATYLAEVERQLPGSRRDRGDLLDEVHDGLLEAADRHARRRSPAPHRDAVAEFGDPTAVGAALAQELRLRLVRRRAARTVLLLVVLAAAWATYRATVGFPSTTVPSGAAGPILLGAIDLVRGTTRLAGAGLVLVVAATSTRWWPHGSTRPLRWLAGATAACLAVAVLAVTVGAATVDAGHRASAAVTTFPTLAVLLVALAVSVRMVRLLGPVPGAEPLRAVSRR